MGLHHGVRLRVRAPGRTPPPFLPSHNFLLPTLGSAALVYFCGTKVSPVQSPVPCSRPPSSTSLRLRGQAPLGLRVPINSLLLPPHPCLRGTVLRSTGGGRNGPASLTTEQNLSSDSSPLSLPPFRARPLRCAKLCEILDSDKAGNWGVIAGVYAEASKDAIRNSMSQREFHSVGLVSAFVGSNGLGRN